LCGEAEAQVSYGTIWVRHFHNAGAVDVTSDSEGNVYVGGSGRRPGTETDGLILKYDPGGTLLWEQWFDISTGPAYDYMIALQVDQDDNLCVTGTNNINFATLKYEPDGNLLWEQPHEGEVKALQVDSVGNIVVTGHPYSAATNTDYCTIKYAPDGQIIWERLYNNPTPIPVDVPSDLAIDNNGNVYVTGRSGGGADNATIKYDSSGTRLWVQHYTPCMENPFLSVDGVGNVYLAGHSLGDGSNYDYTTVKYDSGGHLLWERRYNGPGNSYDKVAALQLDSASNVYVTGYSTGVGTFIDLTTIKYDTDGNVVWTRRYDGPVNSGDVPKALQLDSEGNIYITGKSVGTSIDYAFVTLKSGTNGRLLWTQRYVPPGSVRGDGRKLHIDEYGSLYIVGVIELASSSEAVTIKYIPCSITVSGDVNEDRVITAADIIHSVNYVFKGGTPPAPCEAVGDVNCTGVCDSDDIIYMVNHVFKGGDLPCDVCSSALASACP